jgi:hypothetical protein
VKLKEALEKKTSSIKDSYEFDYLECMEYIDLLESIVLKQDEALSRYATSYQQVILIGVEQAKKTQSEVFKMLQPEGES